MFNAVTQQYWFNQIIWLQIIATVASVLFVKLNGTNWMSEFGISQFIICLIQLLILWNLASLPITLNFYIKMNMSIDSKHPTLVLWLALSLVNTLLVWVYINIITEQKLIRKDIAKILGNNYTLVFLIIAITIIFYIYPLPLFPRL